MDFQACYYYRIIFILLSLIDYIRAIDQSLETWTFDTTAMSMKIIPNQNLVLIGFFDFSIRMYNLSKAQNKPIKKFLGHSDTVNDLIILPDSSFFFSVSNDTTIMQWDYLGPGEPMKVIQASTSCVFTIRYLPNTNLFISVGFDRQINLWNAEDIVGNPNQVNPIVFNGQKFNHTSAIGVICQIMGTDLIASTGADQKVKIWNYTNASFVRQMYGSKDTVFGVAHIQKTNFLVTWSADQTVRLWDYTVLDKYLLVTLVGHDLEIFRGQIIHGTTQLLTLSIDNTMKQWDVYNCKPSCLTCISPIKNDYCLTCPTFSFRIAKPINNLCPCIPGYFDDGHSQCSTCNYMCKTCEGTADHCLECVEDRVLDLKTNTCPCPIGKYSPTGVKQCKTCHFSCRTCSDTSEKCTSCPTGSFRNDLSQVLNRCPCVQNYFSDTTSICEPCHYSCSLCDGGQPSDCLACPVGSNRIYNDATKTCDCIRGYFQRLKVCVICGDKCSTCMEDETLCTKCRGSNRLGIPKCECPKGTYHNSNKDDCQKCLDNCDECSNPLSCSLCKDDRIFKQGECICPSGKFDVQGVCQIVCNDNCVKCASTNDCTCYQGYLQENELCVPQCHKGFFQQRNQLQCTTCYENCISCAGAGAQQCTACKQGFTLDNRMCIKSAEEDSNTVMIIVLGVVLPVMFFIGIGLVWKLKKVKQQKDASSRGSHQSKTSQSQSISRARERVEQQEKDEDDDQEEYDEDQEGDDEDDDDDDEQGDDEDGIDDIEHQYNLSVKNQDGNPLNTEDSFLPRKVKSIEGKSQRSRIKSDLNVKEQDSQQNSTNIRKGSSKQNSVLSQKIKGKQENQENIPPDFIKNQKNSAPVDIKRKTESLNEKIVDKQGDQGGSSASIDQKVSFDLEQKKSKEYDKEKRGDSKNSNDENFKAIKVQEKRVSFDKNDQHERQQSAGLKKVVIKAQEEQATEQQQQWEQNRLKQLEILQKQREQEEKVKQEQILKQKNQRDQLQKKKQTLLLRKLEQDENQNNQKQQEISQTTLVREQENEQENKSESPDQQRNQYQTLIIQNNVEPQASKEDQEPDIDVKHEIMVNNNQKKDNNIPLPMSQATTLPGTRKRTEDQKEQMTLGDLLNKQPKTIVQTINPIMFSSDEESKEDSSVHSSRIGQELEHMRKDSKLSRDSSVRFKEEKTKIIQVNPDQKDSKQVSFVSESNKPLPELDNMSIKSRSSVLSFNMPDIQQTQGLTQIITEFTMRNQIQRQLSGISKRPGSNTSNDLFDDVKSKGSDTPQSLNNENLGSLGQKPTWVIEEPDSNNGTKQNWNQGQNNQLNKQKTIRSLGSKDIKQFSNMT